MNKKTSGLLLTGALLLGLASCSDDNPWIGENGHGAIRLNVSADGDVKKGTPTTKANEGSLFEIPDAADFSIHLTHNDGTFHEFETLEHFKRVESFKTGTYTLRAFYGKLEEQGFNRPYFEGVETVNVLEGRTTEVTINAKVMNSLVSVTYTDEFKNYLSDYSTTIQSEGYEPVKFVGDEESPAFVAPGEVTVTVSFTNPQGQSVTLQPSSFMAKAGVHHILKYNVNGTTADDMSLEILLDDALEEEEVIIDLTEELFTSPAPTVNAKGFDEGEDIEFLAGAAADGKYRFNVVSYGGLNGVTMTLASNNGFCPEFGSPIDLMKATEIQQAQLKALGFDIKGLYKNPDKMAYVDFTEVLKNLRAGEYTLTLQAKDMLTRSSEPVSVNLIAVEPTLNATPIGAIAGLNQGTLQVEYNGTHPMEDLTFMAMNAEGMFVKAPIKDVLEPSFTRSIETHKYNIILTLPDTEHNPIKVQVYLYGEYKQTVELEVSEPDYTLEADSFAHKVWIKVKPGDGYEDMLGIITKNLRIFLEGSVVAKVTSRDEEEGLIMLEGLESGKDYTARGTLQGKTNSNSPSVSFTTEKATPMPNGDFTQLGTKIDLGVINAGGEYRTTFLSTTWHQNKCQVIRDVPALWTTNNSITCNPNSNPMNTWYAVPSTFVEDGKVTVRSVGYNEKGAGIPRYTNAAMTRYFSQNCPSSGDLKAERGLLNLENYNFESRPSSITFNYSYMPYNEETGYMEMTVYSGSEVIGRINKELSASTNTTETLPFSSYPFGKKATAVSVKFVSTKDGVNPGIKIPSGTDLDDYPLSSGSSDWGSWDITLDPNQYKSLAVGSVLTLSNVTLNY